MEVIKEPQQESQQCKATNAKLITMDDTSNTDTLENERFETIDWNKVIMTWFPFLEKVSPVVMDIMTPLKTKLYTVSIYEKFDVQRFNLNLAHGVLLLLYGGSWVGLATLVSFCIVYDVFEVLGRLNFELGTKEFIVTLNTLKQLWLLMLGCYAVYTSPLLSNITIAFMLEKYISDTINSPSIMTNIEKRLPLKKAFGRWRPQVIQVIIRMVLVILSPVSSRFQVCLVMSCIGCQKVYSSLPAAIQKGIDTFEGPLNVDGKPVILWSCAIICSVWQLLNGYHFSFLGTMVPFGFLIKEKPKSV